MLVGIGIQLKIVVRVQCCQSGLRGGDEVFYRESRTAQLRTVGLQPKVQQWLKLFAVFQCR
ncbi:hypothetical protein D3C84_1248250 [compost metagenome]